MKIVICGDSFDINYIVNTLKLDSKKHKLVVIVEDRKSAKAMAEDLQMPIFNGEYTKLYSLEEANIENADLFLALGSSDAKNYVACMLAKKVFNCTKTIADVSNPINVDVFKKLGVDVALSSIHLLSESLKNQATNENVLLSLSLESNAIKILEMIIKPEYEICGKRLMDIEFPENGTISAIFRRTTTIIPKGKTVIKENDKLVICCSRNVEDEIVSFVTRKVINEEKI